MNTMAKDLETYLDRTTLQDMLLTLAEICRDKAEHVQSNWQDDQLETMWNKHADLIEKTAGRVYL